jgi:hypothetical protein
MISLEENLEASARAIAKEASQFMKVSCTVGVADIPGCVAVLTFDGPDCRMYFFSWGYRVIIGSEAREYRFDRIDVRTLVAMSDEQRQEMRRNNPTKIHDVSFGENMDTWSSIRLPGTAAVYVRTFVAEAIRLKTPFTPWSQFQGTDMKQMRSTTPDQR